MIQASPGIYRILNTLNGFSYIGSSVNVCARVAVHRRDLILGKHKNSKLMRAWNKYGEDNFSFNVIEYVDSKDKLISREQYWIDHQIKCGSGAYNIATIAGNTLGVRISDQTRKKISEAKKGRKMSEEARIKMSESKKGKPLPEETKRKISETKRRLNQTVKNKGGYLLSEETRAKMSRSRIGNKNALGFKHSEETKKKISLSLIGHKRCLGKIHTEEARRNMGNARRGKKHTEETKKKISEANFRRWAAIHEEKEKPWPQL